jgi:hypothetical protein
LPRVRALDTLLKTCHVVWYHLMSHCVGFAIPSEKARCSLSALDNCEPGLATQDGLFRTLPRLNFQKRLFCQRNVVSYTHTSTPLPPHYHTTSQSPQFPRSPVTTRHSHRCHHCYCHHLSQPPQSPLSHCRIVPLSPHCHHLQSLSPLALRPLSLQACIFGLDLRFIISFVFGFCVPLEARTNHCPRSLPRHHKFDFLGKKTFLRYANFSVVDTHVLRLNSVKKTIMDSF